MVLSRSDSFRFFKFYRPREKSITRLWREQKRMDEAERNGATEISTWYRSHWQFLVCCRWSGLYFIFIFFFKFQFRVITIQKVKLQSTRSSAMTHATIAGCEWRIWTRNARFFTYLLLMKIYTLLGVGMRPVNWPQSKSITPKKIRYKNFY